MKHARAASALIALSIVTGCASLDPYSFTYTEMSDQSRVYQRPDGDATVVVRREPGFIGSLLTCGFAVDGEKIVDLDRGEQHTFRVPAGQHVIGYWCDTVGNELGFQAIPGKTYYFRGYPTPNAGFQIAEMTR